MPWQSLKQGQYTKLCLLISLFATSLTDSYYQRTTFERNVSVNSEHVFQVAQALAPPINSPKYKQWRP